MYYYYYASAGGAKIWWKKHVTTMQITQFFIDLVAVYFGFYSGYVTVKMPTWPTMGKCAGTLGAAWFGCAILTSYFYLFIDFYFKTYKKKPVAGKKAANASRPGYDTIAPKVDSAPYAGAACVLFLFY